MVRRFKEEIANWEKYQPLRSLIEDVFVFLVGILVSMELTKKRNYNGWLSVRLKWGLMVIYFRNGGQQFLLAVWYLNYNFI
ncbi:MAG: hypothetical protein SVY15_09550 [Halobacteriota archaeon]|nr:hypothetical protein [Halobacteriota archaeon]